MRHRIALAIILGIGVLLRLAWLFQPIRYDEATTYLVYAGPGFMTAATSYSSPNNHVLHSLLVRLCTLWADPAWAIRLPAFVAGCVVPWLTYRVARRWGGRQAGLFAAALTACSGHLIEYATNARGYSMVTAFALTQILLAGRIVRSARRRDFAAFAVVTALGFYTVPTMLYPTAVTAIWAIVVALARPPRVPWRRLAGRAAVFGVACVALTAALYTPVLVQPNGWTNLTGSHWVRPLASLDAWRFWAGRLAGGLIDEWSLGLTPVGVIAVAVLAIFGAFAAGRRRDARPGWLGVGIVVCLALMLVQRVVPFVRVFGFALPVLLATAGVGVAALTRRMRIVNDYTPAAVCLGLAAYVYLARVPDRASAFDKFPDARAVLAYLAAHGNDAVVTGVVPSAPLRYERHRDGQPPLAYRAGVRRLWLVTRPDVGPGEVLKSHRLSAAAFSPPILVFERGSARIYQLRPLAGRTQRISRQAFLPPGTTQPR